MIRTQLRQWQEFVEEDRHLSLSINLSARQLAHPDLLSQIKTISLETGVEPRDLTLEITESLLVEDNEWAQGTLSDLKSLGVHLDLDDFGTGYSSLSVLHEFPFDTLKIDRSFVSRMTEDSQSAELVRTIALLAQNLNLAVVAEGIETAEQLARLREVGCDYGQGHYFSRPLDRDKAQALIVEDPRWHRQEDVAEKAAVET